MKSIFNRFTTVCLAWAFAFAANVYGDVPHYRGKVVLIVDKTMAADLDVSNRIVRLTDDLVGDGWRILRHDVERGLITPKDANNTIENCIAWAQANAPRVREVRAIIKADYDAAPSEVKAVFLIGHIPIPYSGTDTSITGNHYHGAKPADSFYGEMVAAYGHGYGNWSDLESNLSVYEEAPWIKECANYPGDGKFDQNSLPAPMKLAVGRVDLSALSGRFGYVGFEDEASLVSKYFDKDHDFRCGNFTVQRRGISAGEASAFCTTATEQMKAVFGPNDVLENCGEFSWFKCVNADELDYLLGYGFGHSGGNGNGWIGYTFPVNSDPGSSSNNFLTVDSRVVFINLLGSWFGNWDDSTFLNAPLANPYFPSQNKYGYGLTAVLGDLGLDEATLRNRTLGATIGEALFIGFTGCVNSGLMGDPTLRLHSVLPVSGLTATKTDTVIELEWIASSDASVGYNVYRAPTRKGPYTQVNANGPVNGTSYTANCPSSTDASNNFYMVRTVKLETTFVGSYTNMSEGAIVRLPGELTNYLAIQANPATQMMNTRDADGVLNSVSFNVDALAIDAAGDEEVTYQWYKDQTPLTETTHFWGVNSAALLIKGLILTDAGNYHVVVSKGASSLASTSAALTFNEVPIARDDVYEFDEGANEHFLEVLDNDEDHDGPVSLVIESVGFPAYGTADIVQDPRTTESKQVIRYTPRPGNYTKYQGQQVLPPDSFYYVISDGYAKTRARIQVDLRDKSLAHDLNAFGLSPVLITDDFGWSRVLADGSWEVNDVQRSEYELPDGGYFENESRDGDFELTVKVTSVVDGLLGTAGVMLREEGDNTSARFVRIGACSDNTYQYAFRNNSEEPVTTVTGLSSVIWPNAWVRLQRIGDSVTMYTSQNGFTWTQAGTAVNIGNVSSSLKVGVYAYGGNLRATMTDYQVVPIETRLNAVSLNGNEFHFEVLGGPNTSPQTQATVEYSSDLVSWNQLMTVLLNGATVDLTDSSATVNQRFYRLNVNNGQSYSINAIGYIKVELQPGLTLIANQLNRTNNTVDELFGSVYVPDYSVLHKFNGVGYDISAFDPDAGGWDNPNLSLSPGEAAWFQNPTAAALTLRFIGEVPQGTLINPIPLGRSERSAMVPQSLSIGSVMQYPASDYDAISIPSSGGLDVYSYDPDAGGWSPTDPLAPVGTGFWIDTSIQKNWVRAFSVTPMSFTLGRTSFLPNGNFRFDITGGPSGTIGQVERSSDLTNWQPCENVRLNGQTVTFIDKESSLYPNQYYRVKSGNIRSLNRVGFVKVNVPSGYTTIVNPLNHGNNTVEELFAETSVPNGSVIQKSNGEISGFDPDVPGWDNPGMTLNPSETALFQNPSESTVTLRFTGEVP